MLARSARFNLALILVLLLALRLHAQQSAPAVIQAHPDSLLFVTGSEGEGSGFIALIGTSSFLVTNVHVTADIHHATFKTLAGKRIRAGVASMAVGEDIMCMSYPSGTEPFTIMQNVSTGAAVGDPVVVLGNAQGAGVANTITGKIVGIGPNLVEVDAPFVPGNSGSPIIDLNTGTVVGVATYTVTNQYDLTTDQKLAQPIVRRFGYRLDTIRKWQPVSWKSFYAQDTEISNIEDLTNDLYTFYHDLANKTPITRGQFTNPAMKPAVDGWLAAMRNNPSRDDASTANKTLLYNLKAVCEADITAGQKDITYNYFVRELSDQKTTRGQLEDAFQKLLKGAHG